MRLQRGFSIFPDGLAGLGLLLLRATAGCNLVWYSYEQLVRQGATSPVLALTATAFTGGLFLLVGYRTSLGAALGAGISIGKAFGWYLASRPVSAEVRLSAILVAVMAIAILCLGPGVFSLDARRYGRREIIIPQKTQDAE